MRQRFLSSLSFVAAVAGDAFAQVPDPARAFPRGSISGVVRDSLARGPLAGAWVQFVEAGRQATVARTVITDALGRFSFDRVPNGRYTIGFFHALLDSLGVEPLLRQVTVSRGRAARLDRATPTPARLRPVSHSMTTGNGRSAIRAASVRPSTTVGLSAATVTLARRSSAPSRPICCVP